MPGGFRLSRRGGAYYHARRGNICENGEVMRAVLPALSILVLCASAAPEADIEPTGTPNAAYLDAVSGERIQASITYLRPSAPFTPDGEVDVPRPMDPETVRLVWTIGLGVLLAVLVAFAAWFGGRIPVSFGASDPARRRRPDTAAEPAEGGQRLPVGEFLDRLAGMADRRAALILLVGRALDSAAKANGLRLARAQTARDVLGLLPRRWPHFEALRALVREAEFVHFGGRDLPEARWRDCLEAARPLLAEETA